MGCFSIFPCFTNSKHHKHNKSVKPTSSSSSEHQGHDKKPENFLIKIPTQESTNLRLLQTLISKSSDDKTSGVNLDVEINKDSSSEDVEVLSGEIKEGEEKKVEGCAKIEAFVNLENEKEEENVDKQENGKLGVFEQIENEIKKEKENDLEVQVEVGNDNKKEVQSRAISDSSVSSYISYPPMHRYHNNLVINEDEDQVVVQEDSSESLFSLPINARRQSKSCPVEVDDKEVNSPLKTSSSPKMIAKSIKSFPDENDCSQKIDSLLSPIENLAQWKTLKAMPPMVDQEKENFYLEQEDITIPVSEDPSFKDLDTKEKVKTNTAVTTSLSSWLVDPEKSVTVSKEESQYSTENSYAYSDCATSWKSFEDRPILGAWTIDEVKQVSARSSPRKSPCRNPDETPIIGTVGSYWSHTKQDMDSSSSCTSPFGMSAKSRRIREKKVLSCHSSPTKRRLERAFNKTAA
ncbi:hypothetical protein QVD17_36286 [Tagetes erecta]|uniref:Uncharacterized protein n=1 Tax=Tagetes erecta TaxID=13708 RepID=A0AAD8NI25_TARER|nr:hypothetical protein QVD17_36286 [Tagetes erecta]